MRILLVTADYPPPAGGIQTMMVGLERGLREAGHAVAVVNVDGRNTSNLRRMRPVDLLPTPASRTAGFAIQRLLDPRGFLIPGGARDFVYTNFTYRLTRQAVQEFRPDVIHIFKPTLFPAVSDCPIPVLVSCHGEELQPTRSVALCLQRAAAIHCVSGYARGLVNHLDPQADSRIVVIHNSVQVCSGELPPTEEREWLVLTCARLVARKNVDTLLRAWALLPAVLREQYRLAIIGDGTERQRLTALARDLELTGVTFTGQVDEASKSDWFRRGRLFVLCPKPWNNEFEMNEEGFGIVFLEAQAAGMPTIGSNIGGIPEAIGSGGLLVNQPTDPSAVAAAIQSVLENAGVYAGLRKSALARIATFDQAHATAAFERLYEKITQSN